VVLLLTGLAAADAAATALGAELDQRGAGAGEPLAVMAPALGAVLFFAVRLRRSGVVKADSGAQFR
jgi:hypothetical protein